MNLTDFFNDFRFETIEGEGWLVWEGERKARVSYLIHHNLSIIPGSEYFGSITDGDVPDDLLAEFRRKKGLKLEAADGTIYDIDMRNRDGNFTVLGRLINGEYYDHSTYNKEPITDPDELGPHLMRLERWQYLAFSAAAVERLAMICRSFACSESVTLYERGLELAWIAVSGQDVAADAEQVMKKLDKAPECEEDVPGAAYYAGCPLEILANTLEALVRNDAEPASWTCNLALDFRSELDSLLIEESKCVQSDGPGECPPDGPWVLLETAHQRKALELIESAQGPDEVFISSLRRLSQEANNELESAVSEIRIAEKM